MARDEEEEKRKNPPPAEGKTRTSGSIARLVLVNMIFFAVVVGGLLMISGHSLFDLLGLAFWAAKDDDDQL